MSSKKKSRPSKSAAHYEEIYNHLTPFYRFKFKVKKKGFKPSEKSLLSRLDKTFSEYVEGYINETYTFAEASKGQIKALKAIYHKHGPSALGKEQPKNKMVVTNKGVFIPQGKTKAKVDYKIARPKIVGEGKETRIIVETNTRTENFIPRRKGETILDTYNRIRLDYPDIEELYVDVRGHKGVTRYDPKQATRYVNDVLSQIEQFIDDEGYAPEDVFTGFWFMAWKPHPQFIQPVKKKRKR